MSFVDLRRSGMAVRTEFSWSTDHVDSERSIGHLSADNQRASVDFRIRHGDASLQS